MARGLDCSGLSWTQGTGAFLPRQRFRSCSPPRPLLCTDCADSIVSSATDLAVANRLSPSIRSDGHLPHNWRSRVARKNSSPTRHQNCPFLWHFGVSTIRKNKAGKRFNRVDDRIHTVEVIGSNPIAPTICFMVGRSPPMSSLTNSHPAKTATDGAAIAVVLRMWASPSVPPNLD